MALQRSTAVDPRLGALNLDPIMQANAIEQQSLVNLNQSVLSSVENFQKKQQAKQEKEMTVKALEGLIPGLKPEVYKAAANDDSVKEGLFRLGEAQRKSNDVKGRVVSQDEFEGLQGQGFNVSGNPLPNGNILLTDLGTYSQTPSTVINTGDSLSDKLIEDEVKNINKRAVDVNALVDTLGNLQSMQNLLANTDENSQVISGFGADVELSVKSLGNRLGFNNPDVASTQEYLGLAGNQVAQVIKAFGAGTGLSDADREFAKGIAGGQLNMDRDALKRLVGIMKDKGQLIIKNYNDYVQRTSKLEGLSGMTQSFIANKMIPEDSYSQYFTSPAPNTTPTPTPTPGPSSNGTPEPLPLDAAAILKQLKDEGSI